MSSAIIDVSVIMCLFGNYSLNNLDLICAFAL